MPRTASILTCRVRAQVSPFGFVVDKMALGQVFLPVFRFSRVGIPSPLFIINLYITWGGI